MMADLFSLLIIIISLVVIAIVIIFIADYVSFKSEQIADTPVIKFAAFVSFYNINPNRWILHDQYVQCKIVYQHQRGKYESLELFHFSYIDTKRYEKWKRCKEKTREEERKYEKMAWLISTVKEDIKNLESQAAAEKAKGVEIIKGIVYDITDII